MCVCMYICMCSECVDISFAQVCMCKCVHVILCMYECAIVYVCTYMHLCIISHCLVSKNLLDFIAQKLSQFLCNKNQLSCNKIKSIFTH